MQISKLKELIRLTDRRIDVANRHVIEFQAAISRLETSFQLCTNKLQEAVDAQHEQLLVQPALQAGGTHAVFVEDLSVSRVKYLKCVEKIQLAEMQRLAESIRLAAISKTKALAEMAAASNRRDVLKDLLNKASSQETFHRNNQEDETISETFLTRRNRYGPNQ